MRRFAGIVVLAVLIAAGCWFFGLDVVSSVVVALVIVAAGVAVRVLPEPGPAMDWPPGAMRRLDGNRRETSQLSWSLGTGFGAVDSRILGRIRGIADDRLALRQLDLTNPAHRARIERLIGADVYDLLVRDRTRPVRLTVINHALDVLDTLGRSPLPHANSATESHHDDPVTEHKK